MRRYRLVPLLALSLTLAACSSGTPAGPRTVTQIVTATGSAPASSGSAGITVVGPSGSSGASGSVSATGSGAPGTSGTAGTSGTGTATGTETGQTGSTGTSSSPAASSSTAASSTSKDVKVNPLLVACPSLLDPNDIRQATGATVSTASSRIVDKANPKVKMTGKIKCYYGGTSTSKDKPVTVALAQYASVDAAQNQMDVTVATETGLGAQTSTVTVSGKPAHVLLRDGGLLVMRYDTWTLSIALYSKLAPASKLPTGLQKLATMVLARVLKNG